MIKKNRKTGDKIFDNKYNLGEIETNHLKNIEPECFYKAELMGSSIKAIDTYFEQQLYEALYILWQNTEWSSENKVKRKINKDSLSQIYTFFKVNLDDNTYTNVEIFCAIAEFLNYSYSGLFEMISTKYKIELLQEIEEKYPKYFKNMNFPLF